MKKSDNLRQIQTYETNKTYYIDEAMNNYAVILIEYVKKHHFIGKADYFFG